MSLDMSQMGPSDNTSLTNINIMKISFQSQLSSM